MLDEIYEELDNRLEDADPPLQMGEPGRYLLNHLLVATGWFVHAQDRYPSLLERENGGDVPSSEEMQVEAAALGAIIQSILRRRDLLAADPSEPFQPEDVVFALEQAFYSLILLSDPDPDRRGLALTEPEFRGLCALPTVQQLIKLGPDG
jgi:hypothetical protein